MHVLVDGVPPAWLVIQIEDGHAALGRRAELADQILDPAAHKRGVDRGAGIGWIVDDALAIAQNALAAVGPVGVRFLLRPILGYRIAA